MKYRFSRYFGAAEKASRHNSMTEGSSLTSWLLGAAYTGGTLCAGALLLLYVYQDRLLYFPTIPGASKFTKDNPRGDILKQVASHSDSLVLTRLVVVMLVAFVLVGYRHPGEFAIDYEDLMIPSKDGVHVHAWLMKQPDLGTRPTLIFFHGNAGSKLELTGSSGGADIGYRLPNAVQLYRKVGVNVLLVDYRGFGHSEGDPTEQGLKMDAEVAAVILENTFLSISAMVDALMPFLTYVKPLVLRLDWNSEQAIQKLPHPILFIAGLQDELVPHFHMERLRDLATSSRRAVWYPVPGGTHNDSWLRGGDKYFAEMRRFLDALGGQTTCLVEESVENGVASLAEENAIPTMLRQPLINTLHKAQKPKAE
ncbi:hypothetical protein BBJ28_00001246 [Nothophytophthora sp. Chile5]|nr:hypothetical protein BBJ28_00001246 [Nothophytophthora sp. Chile5]